MIENIIGFIAGFVINAISQLGYAGIAVMMAIESMCIPLPSEIIMPFSGFLVSKGQFTLIGITMAGSVGSVVGSIIAYAAGAWGGRDFIQKYGKYILITNHDLEIADRFFTKYGRSAIFFSRMLPVVRTFISLPAGISRMNFSQFVAYTFIGSLPWCFALGYLGEILGDRWDILGGYFHKFDVVIVVLFFAGVAWFIKRHINIRKYEQNNNR